MNHTEQKNKTEKLKKLVQLYKEHTSVEQNMDVVLIKKDSDYERENR